MEQNFLMICTEPQVRTAQSLILCRIAWKEPFQDNSSDPIINLYSWTWWLNLSQWNGFRISKWKIFSGKWMFLKSNGSKLATTENFIEVSSPREENIFHLSLHLFWTNSLFLWWKWIFMSLKNINKLIESSTIENLFGLSSAKLLFKNSVKIIWNQFQKFQWKK